MLDGVITGVCEDGAIERAAAIANCCSACATFFCNLACLVAGLFALSKLDEPVSKPALREFNVDRGLLPGLEEIVCF